MKYLLILILTALLGSCSPKPSNEMEEISHDVIKANRGVQIEVTPIDTKK